MDFKALMQEANEIKENGGGSGEYKEVEAGEYEVAIDKLELGKSKAGNDMLVIWFTILEGEFKNSKLFYNQAITSGFGLHKANEMLRSLKSDVPVAADSIEAYADMVADIFDDVTEKYEYQVKYAPKAKDTLKITDVFNI